ncbi:LamG-like jellyroll fold domain-containing protein [Streptomyces sp. NPDC088348]|uniref:LamG-like jellyroll fold domain-containing protein n=1 Tax=Streptomyces sp. NPDC088348 TaxID=3365853 RepID=UPI00382C815D
MPSSGERERPAAEDAAPSSPATGSTPDADDLTLARKAAGGGDDGAAAGAELMRRHFDPAVAYAARCTATPQDAALLAVTASEAAVQELPANDTDTAWRPHLLALVLRTAAEWSHDERRERLSAGLLAWLSAPEASSGQASDAEPPLAAAFHRLPVRLQVGLWHLTVEQDGVETVARLLGTEANAVRAWAPTVGNRLRSAYVEILEEHATPACRPFARLLITASESDRHRADAVYATSGLEEHLAVCVTCRQALQDLTHLRGPGRGAALAGVLLPWGGADCFPNRAAPGGAGRPVPGPHRVGEGTTPGRELPGIARRLQSVRSQRTVLIPLAACATVIAAVVAFVGGPQFEETGHRTLPQPSAPDDVLAGPTSSAATSPPPSPRKRHRPAKQVSKSPRAKPSTSPSPSHTPPPPASALALPGAGLRWDFSTARPKAMGSSPGSFVGGARTDADRGGSATFDGTGYIQSGGPVVDTERSFTVSAWVRPTSKSGFQTVAGQDGGHVSGFFLQYSDEADRWRLAMGDSDSADGDESDVLSLASPRLGQWQHLTAVFDAGNHEIRLYVGGVLQGHDRHWNTWAADGPFTVGRGQWEGAASDLFHGGIDDVRVYGRALGTPEVETLAKARPNA